MTILKVAKNNNKFQISNFKFQIGYLLFTILLLITYNLSFITSAYAICPVCTVAVGAGIGFSRWLGIDDTITGLWIGAFLLSSSLWLSNWLDKKHIQFRGKTLILAILFYSVSIVPLFISGIIGHPQNTFFGVDKIIFGILTGTAVFLVSLEADKFLRLKNNGKVAFYYQKVVLPVSLLIIGSFVFYLLTR